MPDIFDINKQQLEALREGNYYAFTELYNAYGDMLYSFVLQLTKSPSEAKDIVQEIFLRIWLNRHNIALDKSFKAYLYQIARNLIIDTFRKQVNKISFEQYVNSNHFSEYVNNNIEDKISYDDFIVLLEKAKQKMTERQREIFILSREKDLKTEEIAKILNLSEKTVQNTLSLAIGIVRAEIMFLVLALTNNQF